MDPNGYGATEPPWKRDYPVQKPPQQPGAAAHNLQPPWHVASYEQVPCMGPPAWSAELQPPIPSHPEHKGHRRHASRSRSRSRSRGRHRSRSRSRGRHRSRDRSRSRDGSRSRDRSRSRSKHSSKRARRSRSRSRRRRDRSRSYSRARHRDRHSSRSRERRRGRSSPRTWSHDLYEEDDRPDRRRGASGSYDSWREGSSGRDAEGSSRWRDMPPSSTLFIKGIPETCDESDLSQLLINYPDITGIRVVRDKHTGAHRGFGFVDFSSVDSARRLMESEERHGLTLDKNILTFDYTNSYAQGSRAGGGGDAGAAGAASFDWICDTCSAVNFARRMECYRCKGMRPAAPRRVVLDQHDGQFASQEAAGGGAGGWAPKEFADQPDESGANQEASAWPSGQTPAGGDAADQGNASDYVYDSNTGYYWMPSIEAYYDPGTSLYFFQSTNQWCQVDPATNTYVPVEQPAVTAAAGNAAGAQVQQVQGAAPGMASGTGKAAGQAAGGAGETKASAAERKVPKGAVIGAAPQYNPHALLLAAQAIKGVKEKSSNTTRKPGATKSAATKIKGPTTNTPGLGATGTQPGKQAPTATNKPAANAAAAPTASAQGAGPTQPVAGVIHKSRWAQSRAGAQ